MGKPDALTRRTGNEKTGADERVFKEGQLLAIDVMGDVEVEAELLAMNGIEAEEVADVELEEIDCSGWKRDHQGLLEVPENYREEVLRQCHDSKVAGHWGRHRTQELISRDFIWEGWREDVASYIASCQKC